MIYDISQEVFSCQVYPGDPAPARQKLQSIERGDVCNLTAFSMCAHNGTHLDAPYHFLRDGKTIDQMDLSVFVGPAWVTHRAGDISAAQAREILAAASLAGAGERLLIGGPAVISAEAARVFAGGGVLLVGNESQSVGPESAPAEVHRILLGAGTALLEGIRLGRVPEGRYLLCAAPLNLGGSDGAPCRAVLISEDL